MGWCLGVDERLGVVSVKGGIRGCAREKFSWLNSNLTILTPTFSKDEFLNSCIRTLVRALLWLIQVSAFGKKNLFFLL